MNHPMQPIVLDEDGTRRFKQNAIVRFLLDGGPFDLNMIGAMPFSTDDRRQFAQLIGYSESGYDELSYVGVSDAEGSPVATMPIAIQMLEAGWEVHWSENLGGIMWRSPRGVAGPVYLSKSLDHPTDIAVRDARQAGDLG